MLKPTNLSRNKLQPGVEAVGKAYKSCSHSTTIIMVHGGGCPAPVASNTRQRRTNKMVGGGLGFQPDSCPLMTDPSLNLLA